MSRLHLVRPEAALAPALAEGERVVYIEPTEPLTVRDPDTGDALDADALLHLIFQHRVVITW